MIFKDPLLDFQGSDPLYCNSLSVMTTSTTIQFYDLAGAEDDRVFSPNCWRVRLSLLHKGIPFETVPCRFTEKETIAFSGQQQLPILVDRERTVPDSWAIANYLEETYPERPSLFGGPIGQALALFMKEWTGSVVHSGLVRMIIKDIYDHLHEKDKDYFRQTREAAFGATLEDLCAHRQAKLPEFQASLAPLRATLTQQPYLSGQDPLWSDYVVFSAFQWARMTSSFQVLDPQDPVYAWRERMLDLFDGVARKAPGYAG